VDNFVTNLQNDYDCIDILVNNAAIAFKAADPTPFAEQAAPTISVNYFGTLYITQNLLPLIKKSNTPRIVNIASLAGHLGILKSPERVKHFANPQLTIEELGNLMNEFINDVQTGQHASKGWPNSCYGVSKLGVIALTKILARTEPDIIVNACCPGYCKTDMSSHRGIRSAEEGARTPAYLALLPSSLDCPTGLFFKDEAPVEW
jgi:carbonyl reductase 1